MSRFVIDARTLLCVIESGIAIDPAHRLVAPGSIRSQALDLLLQRVRAGDLSEREALGLHERVTETRLRLLNDRVSRRAAWDLARAKGWDTIRDAEYLALTRLQADALVTIDDRLAAAAAGVVPLATVEQLTGN